MGIFNMFKNSEPKEEKNTTVDTFEYSSSVKSYREKSLKLNYKSFLNILLDVELVLWSFVNLRICMT